MIWQNWLSRWNSGSQHTGSRRRDCRFGSQAELLEERCLLTGNGVIEGTSFLDVNESGAFDDGDIGLSGLIVFLDANENGELDSTSLLATATDTPVVVPDTRQGSSVIEVTGITGIILDVNVTIDIVHTYDGDLRITLISPNGDQLRLATNVGGGGDNFLQTVLDDEAAADIGEGSAPFTGSFRPEDSLSVLNGLSPNGVWTLKVEDTAGADEGAITGFQLSFVVSAETTSVTNGDGRYQFGGLDAGDYVVAEVVRPGLIPTSPEAFQYSVALGLDETRSELDFGHAAIPAVIHGQKWNDLNGDGQHQPTEPGLDGWMIEVLDAISLQVVARMETTSIDLNGDSEIDPQTESGLYSFESLLPGRYLVREVQQEGWTGTFPEADRNVADDDPVTQAGEYVATTPPTGSAESPADWLPDLIIDMESSSGLRDVYIDGSVLRFGQATPNVGHGALRIVGGADNGDGTQQVLQRIYSDQVSPDTGERLYRERDAGNFSFHPEHNHIHFNEFARYALRTALPDTDSDGVLEVGDIVRGGTKTSFCLINIEQYDTELPNFDSDGSGLGCDVEQEISVGWEDIYGSGTEGQEINIAGLEPGTYWLEAVVDPDDHFTEIDETNNIGRILVHIAPADRLHEVSLDPGDIIAGLDFGNFELASISGTVIQDTNANGVLQPNEVGQPGVAVYIDLNGDHILNNSGSGDGVADGLAEEPWAITDNDGRFRLVGLDAGDYQVRIVAPAGLSQTTETPDGVSVNSGQDVGSLKFGVGTITNGTTNVNLRSDNHYVDGGVVSVNLLSIVDETSFGQADNLQIEVLGFQKFSPVREGAFFGGSPVVRIHDPNHVLIANVGIQEGLHTVYVPLTEALSIQEVFVFSSGGNDRVFVDLGASDLLAFVDGGTGHDRLEVIGSGFHDHSDHDHSDVVDDPNDNNFFQFGSFNNVIYGLEGNDTLLGGASNDLLFGGEGNDILNGGEGDDHLVGDEGADTISGGEGIDTTRWGSGGGNDLVKDSDRFFAYATDSADRFTLDLNRRGVPQLTQLGNQPSTITLADVSRYVYLNTLGGNDSLTMNASVLTKFSVFFDGSEGNDLWKIIGTAGADSVITDDVTSFDPEQRVVLPFPTIERIDVSLGAGHDRFDASGTGYEIPMSIHGDGGNDTIIGSIGNDRIFGDAGTDVLLGGLGNDTITGGAGDDVIVGDAGNDNLNGEAGADTIVGGSGNNTLLGGAGNDLLIGGEDNDLLNGQGGQDRLFGGGGLNRFARPAPGEIVTTIDGFNLDEIFDLL